MGVFLNLCIAPERISADDWSAVYRETLVLLGEFPFLDRIKAENGYCYGGQSAHRENVLEGYDGWHVTGDVYDGCNMESFFLIDDIAYYRKKVPCGEQDERDILLWEVSDHIEEVQCPPCAWVWMAKTQGKTAHLYLLAIACLICHRFPDAALVSGDISAGQCRRAVEWANQYLEVPIDVPVTADINRLMPRLLACNLEEKDIIPALFCLTQQPKHGEVGASMRGSIPASVIESYYKERLKPDEHDPDRLYLDRSTVKEYLGLGLNFETLCRMVMVDPDGNQIAPREFMKVLLEMKFHVHIDDKVLYDFVANPKELGTSDVETVYGMLASALLAMHGARNRNVAAYMPLEQIISVFESVVGVNDYQVMVKELLEEIEASAGYKSQNDVYDGPDSFYREALVRNEAEKEARAQPYDIVIRDDVVAYRDGDSVEPKLDASLIGYAEQLRKIGRETYDGMVNELTEEERKAFFHERYKVLIPKEVEDRFFARIMDEDYIIRYVGLYSVEINEDVRWVIRGFLWNPELLDHYWELSENEASE